MASDPYKACEDFHRTASRARDIGVTRRQVLVGGVAAGLALYTSRALPLTRALDAAGDAHAQAPDAPILVVVFLPGGVDLLDTLVPLSQYGPYRDARAVMAQPDVTTPKLGNTGLGIHTSLTKGDGEGIKGLFDRGEIGFLPGIDYANPDMSHFHSRHFWETGLITPKATTGWMGRWLDLHGTRENPFQGLSSGHYLSPVLHTAGAPVAAVQSAKGAELWMQGLGGDAYDRAIAAYTEIASAVAGEAAGPESVRRAARLAREVAVRLEPYKNAAPAPQTQPGTLPVIGSPQVQGYPTGSGFADRLRSLAFLLAQPLGVRIATVDADGDFDTHANQQVALTRDLEEISRALAAFQSDLVARGLSNRVLTFVWSEFGRRVKANESGGTDHGAGGNGWVQGPRAAGGILTEYPSLVDLDKYKNLKVTVDFRQIYASLVEQWLGTDAAAVVPDAGAFGRVKVVD
jgi:uncharacterized protein (DUF1501 family)